MGTATSNQVTLVIENSKPPTISSLTSASGPPGAPLQIRGSGFAVNEISGGSQISRTSVNFRIPTGEVVPVMPISTSQTSIQVSVPPISLADGSWYQGPVAVYIQVDSYQVCGRQTFTIRPAVRPSDPPGQILLSTVNDALQVAANSIPNGTSSPLFQLLQTQVATASQNFQNLVAAAVAGTPQTITVTGPDGSPLTVTFGLAQVIQVESLLTASNPFKELLRASSVGPQSKGTSRAATDACYLIYEQALHADLVTREALDSTLNATQYAILFTALSVQLAACATLTPAGCLAGLTALGAITEILYEATAWPILIAELTIDYGENYLVSLSVSPSQPAPHAPGQSVPIAVFGTFSALSILTDVKTIATQTLNTSLGRQFGKWCEHNAFQDLCSQYLGILAGLVVDHFTGQIPLMPSGSQSRQVELGSESISVQPVHPEASVRLGCATGTEVDYLAPTDSQGVNFIFQANHYNLLTLADLPPLQTSVNIIVSDTVQSLTLSTQSTFGGQLVDATVTLVTAAPTGGIFVQLQSDNQAAYLVDNSIFIEAGQSSVSFSVNTRSVSASQTATITATAGGRSATATLAINPTNLMINFTPGTVIGGNGGSGTISITSAPSAAISVQLTSDNAAAQPPGSVQINAGNTSVPFIVPTSVVTSTQIAHITASYQGSSATTALEIDPQTSQVTLTVQVTGTGTVTSSPAGIVCSIGTCSDPFAQGTQITLTEAVPSGSTFVGWGGACAPAGKSTIAQLTLTSDVACSAVFQPSATGPFAGSWNLIDTASDGISYPGTLIISQVAANGSFAFTINGTGGYIGTGTSTGSNLTLDGTSGGLRGHWVGMLDPTGRRIDGTWTQSDGQVGTWVATR